MTHRGFDVHHVVAANGAPRPVRVAEVVKVEFARRLRVDEELAALYAGLDEIRTQSARHRVARHERREDEPNAGAELAHHAEQRQELGLDGHLPSGAALGRLDLRRAALRRAVDVDESLGFVDVAPIEHADLAGARPGVDGERPEPSPLRRVLVEREDLRELAREEVRAGALVAYVGTAHVL